jgi:tetratricopeptide (TPR) repeat protein
MGNYIEERDYSKNIIKHYTQLIEFTSNNPRHYNIRGCAYYKQGKLEEAALDFTRAIELESIKPLYYQNRAAAYYKLNQYEKAAWDYTQVITLNNMDKEAYINSESAKVFLRRADAFRLQGNLNAAIEDYEKANYIMMNLNLESNESDHDAYCDEVKEYTCKKEHNKNLIKDYTELIKLNSNELEYYYIRGTKGKI